MCFNLFWTSKTRDRILDDNLIYQLEFLRLMRNNDDKTWFTQKCIFLCYFSCLRTSKGLSLGRFDRCIFMHLFLCIFPLINPCYTHFSVKLSIFSNFSVFMPKHRYSHTFWLFFRNFEATGILRMIMGGYSSNFGSIGAKMKNVKNRSFGKEQWKTRPSWVLPSERLGRVNRKVNIRDPEPTRPSWF